MEQANNIAMHVLDLHNEHFELTLPAGQSAHFYLFNPENATLRIRQEAESDLLIHCITLNPSFSSEAHQSPSSQVVSADTLASAPSSQPTPSASSPSSPSTEIIVEHVGQGCRTRLYGMALLKGEQQAALTTRVLHTVGGGYSDQLFKFVLADRARGSFYGELKVQPDAQKTEAHQTNRNILLSPTAKMRTMPQLEIYADDVKCSHGATTGQLDSAALFYMQQRGISEASARRLLLVAFLSDVFSSLPESTASHLHQLIDEAL